MKLAVPLLIERNKVQFKSLINGRFFSLAKSGPAYGVFELTQFGFVKRTCYMGDNAAEARRVVLREICDVRR